jgi:hypothetical protein
MPPEPCPPASLKTLFFFQRNQRIKAPKRLFCPYFCVPALGEVLKCNAGLLPKPLDTALSQVWAYASNEARHIEEGREPGRDEAELLLGLCAAVSTFLTRKHTN